MSKGIYSSPDNTFHTFCDCFPFSSDNLSLALFLRTFVSSRCLLMWVSPTRGYYPCTELKPDGSLITMPRDIVRRNQYISPELQHTYTRKCSNSVLRMCQYAPVYTRQDRIRPRCENSLDLIVFQTEWLNNFL